MNYGELFGKAWKIIKKFKVLWVFGFLAGCGATSGAGGGSGNTGYQFNSGDTGSGSQYFNSHISPAIERMFHFSAINDEQVWLWIVAAVLFMIVVGFCLGLLTLVLRSIGRGGLVRGAWDADEGHSKLTFGSLWKSGVKNFWRILLFTGLMWLINLGLGIILFVPVILFTLATLGCGLIFLIPVLIAMGWMMTAWFQLGVVAIVGDEVDVMEGFRRSWHLMIKNFWKVLLVSLIVVVATFVIGLILFVPFLLTIVPLVIGFAMEAEVLTLWIVLSAVLFLVYLLVVIVLSAGVQGYMGTVWTLLYRRLSGKMGVEIGSVEPVEPVVEPEVKETPETPAPREVLPGESKTVVLESKPLPDPDKPA